MQADLVNVTAESSSAVMVLAVDVVGDGPANSNEASARRDGKKPSSRKKYIENVGQADTTFAANHARRFVETENAVEASAVDQFAAGVETRITVTTSETMGEQ